jgi:phasin family protein
MMKETFMFPIPNPASTAGNLESQFSMAVSLANKALESVNRLTDLHLNLARATLEHSNLVARQLISAEDREELFSVVSAQTQPNARRTFDYTYYLTTIVTCAQMDFINIVGEGIADTNRKVVSLATDGGNDLYCQKRIEVACDSRPENTIDVIVHERARSNGGGPTALQ